MNSGTTAEAKGQQGRSGATAGVMLFACVGLLALPSAVLAFGNSFQPDARRNTPIDNLGAEAENLVGRAGSLASRTGNVRWPFTPAGTPDRSVRSVTVAVRVDPSVARSIIVRGKAIGGLAESEPARLRISQTAFNLGVARGYQNFAQDPPPSAARGSGDLPSLKTFSLAPGATPTESRFSPRISFDEKRAAGRSPRTFSGDGSEVDLGGAYRVTENLDVTAGVRYSQDRERLVPLNDGKQQDSQAVYVGTQFRF
ncbi:hypothetical protein [Novosphingobium colocasiae]|uniref:Porin n=1 Tax=Novosphingobium colocasiae TaxID=1256513 RepID=A0A918UBZ1_9SPHN|nr:hypothetical protein [Novosphingobium colocasiae]GGY89713.1 hypothetical protein GCM10011614_00220 [Novosphingobium colocasiae]